MPNFAEGIKNAARQAVCNGIANSADFNDALSRSGFKPGFTPNIPRQAQKALCSNPSDPPVPPPPFNGGQCPTNYFFEINYSYENLLLDGSWETRTSSKTGTVMGPVPTGSVRRTSGGNTSPCGSAVTNVAYVFARNATRPEYVQGIEQEYLCGSFIGAIRNVNVTGVTLTRSDGLGDTCGTAVPVPIPYPTGGIPSPADPFDYDPDDGGGPITVVPIPVLLKPTVNIDGKINVPVKIDVGGVNFNLNVNIETGDINFNFGGPQGNRKPDGTGGSPDGSQPGSDPPPPSGDAPDPEDERPDEGEPVIIGVLVRVTNVNVSRRASVIGQDENPDIYVPSLGHVNFLCRLGNCAVGGWTSDQPVKNRNNLIVCPWPYGAIAVQGTPQPGVEWSLIPVYDSFKSPVEGDSGTKC